MPPGNKLLPFIKGGVSVSGFGLAEKIVVGSIARGMHTVKALDSKTKDIKEIVLKRDTVYAQMDILLKPRPTWKISHYFDTRKRAESSGLILERLEGFGNEAKMLGMSGIIVLINGKEPGNGTVGLDNFTVKTGDVIEIVYKKENARY